jgi:triosephosphate isomerase
MRKKIVAGNWKMHKNAEQTEDLLNELITLKSNRNSSSNVALLCEFSIGSSSFKSLLMLP